MRKDYSLLGKCRKNRHNIVKIFNAAFWKNTKHNLGRLHGVVHRDKEGRLRLGYPDEIKPEDIVPDEIPF